MSMKLKHFMLQLMNDYSLMCVREEKIMKNMMKDRSVILLHSTNTYLLLSLPFNFIRKEALEKKFFIKA